MAKTPTKDHQLTLYFIPSPVGMDWSSPANLAWSALKNRLSFQPRFMGHVFVEFQCGDERQLTGMVGKNFDYLHQLFIESRGLGILYHSFAGQLEEAKDVEKELSTLSQKSERLNFVRFLLNQGQCKRITTYMKEYRELNIGRYYGLANRPLYGEGAGCSAFGASFLEVAGILDQEFKDEWSQTVNIPMAFAGPPLKDEGVNLFKLMFNAGRWASGDEFHKKITFWDPDRMFNWVKNKLANAGMKNFSVVNFNQARGIVIDRSYLPSPQGPIWQQKSDPDYYSK